MNEPNALELFTCDCGRLERYVSGAWAFITDEDSWWIIVDDGGAFKRHDSISSVQVEGADRQAVTELAISRAICSSVMES
jgi:hypothetical protein